VGNMVVIVKKFQYKILNASFSLVEVEKCPGGTGAEGQEQCYTNSQVQRKCYLKYLFKTLGWNRIFRAFSAFIHYLHDRQVSLLSVKMCMIFMKNMDSFRKLTQMS
jgi:hypothetical protein